MLRSCRSRGAQGAGLEAAHRAEGEGLGALSPPARPGASRAVSTGPWGRKRDLRAPSMRPRARRSLLPGRCGPRATEPEPLPPGPRPPAPLHVHLRAPPPPPLTPTPHPPPRIPLATSQGSQTRAMPVRGGRWGSFWELRARQLQRQLQVRDPGPQATCTPPPLNSRGRAARGGAGEGLGGSVSWKWRAPPCRRSSTPAQCQRWASPPPRSLPSPSPPATGPHRTPKGLHVLPPGTPVSLHAPCPTYCLLSPGLNVRSQARGVGCLTCPRGIRS